MRPTISFAPTVRLKRLTATSPPKRLVTASTSSKLIGLAGGPEMAPKFAERRGYAPSDSPAALERAAAEPWRASGSARNVSSPPPHPAHDSLGQERDDQDQHEAVEHDVHAGAPADDGAGWLGGRSQDVRADDRAVPRGRSA